MDRFFGSPVLTVITLAALSCFGVAGFNVWRSLRLGGGNSATGRIVALERDAVTDEFGIVYHPIVAFVANGVTIRTRTRASERRRNAGVGETVTVRYDPANPERAELAGRGGQKIGQAALYVLVGSILFYTLWTEGF